jgi:DNA-binding GntR family transcriptional regulator
MTTGATQGVGLERLDAVPPLHYRVHQQLEALIVSRAMPPGSRIVESDLASQLGVSRGPIREALQILARDGFVDLRPRQGTFVHQPTHTEVADFFDVRRPLEMTSAGLAAQRVTPDQAKHLKELIDIAEALLNKGEDPSAHRDEVDMHAQIIAVANNTLLAAMLANLKRRSDWYSPPFDPANRRTAWAEHLALVTHIVDQDVAAAEALMGKHIDRARDHYFAASEGGATRSGDSAFVPAR